MRLINTRTIQVEEFTGDVPKYAILSHTWGEEECTLKDMEDTNFNSGSGYEKIKLCCKQALENGLEWVWVDTCCIDKTSSSELSEAINSMYIWYANAEVCYAYLSDFSCEGHVEFGDLYGSRWFTRGWKGHVEYADLCDSRWFTRGWTLQELIAPKKVVFFTKEWKKIAEKSEIVEALSFITGIPKSLLSNEAELDEFSVAARMSWASNRNTTRVEDEAYSLMGLFGVNMPLIYGERENAFIRLQEEILKITDDQSIFAWVLKNPKISQEKGWQVSGLLAEKPSYFENSKDIVSMGIWGKGHVHGMVNRGLHAKLFLHPMGHNDVDYIASLDCWSASNRWDTVVIFLRRLGSNKIDWKSPHETIFVRYHPMDNLGAAGRLIKKDGMYREICVPQKAKSPEVMGLRTYDHTGSFIMIHSSGCSFSVHPAACWEPQTAVFEAPHNKSGIFGFVRIQGDDCVYMTYFGRNDDTNQIWVKAEVNTSELELIDDDYCYSYEMDGKETTASETIHTVNTGPSCYDEKLIAKVNLRVVYQAEIFEIHVVLENPLSNRRLYD